MKKRFEKPTLLAFIHFDFLTILNLKTTFQALRNLIPNPAFPWDIGRRLLIRLSGFQSAVFLVAKGAK
jgi:hypothetical protein